MAVSTSTKLLSHLAHSASEADADRALRYRTGCCNSREIVLTGTVYIPLLRADKALSVVDAQLIPDSSVSATANSRDFALVTDDGAGGGFTVLGTEIDGTATAITADQASDLGAVEGTSNVAEGEYLYLRTTHNGTGVALSVAVTFTYRYD